jgi:phosphoribosylanthranilate isomerase
MVRFKVCCIQSVAEAELALAHGASAIGLVSAMPSGPGPIPDDLIREVARWATPRTRTFLLTSRTDVAGIAAQVRDAGVNTVQLVDTLPKGAHAALRAMLPMVRLVQVIHVQGPASLDEALAVAPLVDELLLDSGNPAAPVKELGGTGRVHDWSVSRRIVREAGVPVWLAGGLRPENVDLAVREVGPHGVDVCSGLRVDGALHPDRLARFVAALTQDA